MVYFTIYYCILWITTTVSDFCTLVEGGAAALFCILGDAIVFVIVKVEEAVKYNSVVAR